MYTTYILDLYWWPPQYIPNLYSIYTTIDIENILDLYYTEHGKYSIYTR